MRTVTTVFKLLENVVVVMMMTTNVVLDPNAKRKHQTANHTALLHGIPSLNKKNSSKSCSTHMSNNQPKNSSVNQLT